MIDRYQPATLWFDEDIMHNTAEIMHSYDENHSQARLGKLKGNA